MKKPAGYGVTISTYTAKKWLMKEDNVDLPGVIKEKLSEWLKDDDGKIERVIKIHTKGGSITTAKDNVH